MAGSESIPANNAQALKGRKLPRKGKANAKVVFSIETTNKI